MTDGLNIISFAMEKVKYDVGLLTLEMKGYEEHKLFVNSQLKSLDKSIKKFPNHNSMMTLNDRHNLKD